MPAKNDASTRYSELDQINVANVDQLQLAWSFSNGVNPGIGPARHQQHDLYRRALAEQPVRARRHDRRPQMGFLATDRARSDWRCVLRRGQPRRRL